MVNAPMNFDSHHEDVIHDAQFDYYGKRLATCSSDRTIRIFDVEGESQTLIDTLKGHDGPVWAVAWAHPKYGSLLASASYDGRIFIWKEVNGQFTKIHEHTGHSASVNSIAWAPPEHGLVLASASSDGYVCITTYDGESGTWGTSTKIQAHVIGVNAVAWAPSTVSGALYAAHDTHADSPIPAARFASAGCDNLIKLWQFSPETKTYEPVATLDAHTDWVRDVAFAPNVGIPAQYLASCSQDKTVYIWTQTSPVAGFEKKKLHTFADVVWRVSWSLAGDVLAVSSGDNKVTLWRENVEGEWECISTLEE
ncbi:hypothetical protein AMAG_08777 [Allomyces macrogynus ATCC 38327]|uniref:Uncharacterized protein n=1 Tax=Allomyces macrogynus (strain ATCC 38327) TaxID=578462 RepID=A0A0L0SM87_ALLM3|nr:hypothetical protein AMAG_08777 [Allomyces macrogynus ATCC 38327]|eukprot:KNE63681.1 hypothetical protein AMAG_08777 [Allomyces macrogynus ATCC 38327]